jgi:hypothetical protein
MSNYRLFQINQTDHIVDGHVVTCASDDEAAAVAPQYLAGYAAVEVWCDRRRITRLASPQTGTDAALPPRPIVSS